MSPLGFKTSVGSALFTFDGGVCVTHFLRFTFGAIPADLLIASMAAELISSSYLRRHWWEISRSKFSQDSCLRRCRRNDPPLSPHAHQSFLDIFRITSERLDGDNIRFCQFFNKKKTVWNRENYCPKGEESSVRHPKFVNKKGFLNKNAVLTSHSLPFHFQNLNFKIIFEML